MRNKLKASRNPSPIKRGSHDLDTPDIIAQMIATPHPVIDIHDNHSQQRGGQAPTDNDMSLASQSMHRFADQNSDENISEKPNETHTTGMTKKPSQMNIAVQPGGDD